MSITIHNTAVVHAEASISEGVEIGPYAVVGRDVVIGSNTKIGPHVVLDGWTEIGRSCDIGSSSVIGSPPQDVHYKGAKAFVRIGDNNTLREYVTVHRASKEGGATIIGSDNFIMAYSHIAHDCILGNNIIIANYAGLSGHVEIGDRAVISGLVGVHQFVRIGKMCMIGGMSRILKDIVPFVVTDGHTAVPRGINALGLRRNGMESRTRSALKQAFKLLFRSSLNTEQAIVEMSERIKDVPEIEELIRFIQDSRRGIAKPGQMGEEEGYD